MKLCYVICLIFMVVAVDNCLGNLINLALGKSATQSSTGWNGTASLAVDGNKSSNYYVYSCTHTFDDPLPPWWQVDLEKQSVIYQLKIQNRNNHGDRLTDFDIFAGMATENLEICAYFKGPGANDVEYTINCTSPIIGRYVRIEKRQDTQYLTLCEVEVMGRYPEYTNLALNQSATQSTTGWGGVASRAVDGDKNPNYYADSCTHTNTTPVPHWWQVELENDSLVSQVKIKNRNEHGDRLANLNVYVGRSTCHLKLCAYFEGPGENSQEYTLNCTIPTVGKFVKIQKLDDVVLTLCEVEVMAMSMADV